MEKNVAYQLSFSPHYPLQVPRESSLQQNVYRKIKDYTIKATKSTSI
jgi:hypothetical protein